LSGQNPTDGRLVTGDVTSGSCCGTDIEEHRDILKGFRNIRDLELHHAWEKPALHIITLIAGRWRRLMTPKLRYLCIIAQTLILQKEAVWTSIAAGTSSLIKSFTLNTNCFSCLFDVYWTVHHCDRWQMKKLTRCHSSLLFYFLEAQHVSGVNMPIFRSLRLCCWTTTASAEADSLDTTLAEPNSNTQQIKNETANVVVQQHSRKLLKMGILMPETCWASKK